jgi:hypothetical protein
LVLSCSTQLRHWSELASKPSLLQAGPYSTRMRSISACILAARSWGVEQAASRSALAAAMMSCRMVIPFP